MNDYTVFDAEGTTALRTHSQGVLEVTDFTAEERPLEELRAFAEMLSGRRLNAAGRLVPLSEERFRDDWKHLEAWAWPADARALLDPVWWHRREADAAAETRFRGGPRRGSLDGALWHLDRLLALKPGDARALQQRAEMNVQARHWPEALADYTALIDAGSQFHMHRGIVYASLGKWTEAEADFKAVLEKCDFNKLDALKYDFNKPDALSGLALLRLRPGTRSAGRRLARNSAPS